ncbi:MAG: mercury(II) reductase [Gemmatimonadota bacterium]|nr:mercury(II) reductase [Gemmatimonadota bacterium]
MKTVELAFEGLTCLDCARRVERALAAVPGVGSAEVSYPTRSGTVSVEEAVSTDALLQAVAETGYEARVQGDAEQNPLSAPAEPAHREPAGTDYDLVIIGSGAAGMAAAIRASEMGRTAAVVEGGEVIGGTCVNIGCIPSKYLIEAAHHYHTARTAFPGITPCDPQLAWAEVLRRKREIVETLREEKYHRVLDSYEGVTLLRGRARLLGGGRVQVGDAEVTGGKVVIATDTRPAMPPIPGLAEAGALDSTTAMELEKLPASMIVIGAGAIGLELGQAFARFGVRVIVIEALERILPTEDPAVSTALHEALVAEGVEIHTGMRVAEVAREGTGYLVRVQDGSLSGEIRAEQLLVATGGTPNTEDLGLDAADVRRDARGFVPVDRFMRTSNPVVLAAGDVTGGPGYVYVAAYEGGIAAQTTLAEVSGEEAIAADLSTTPRVTFTDPQVAAVGMTEEEARAAGLNPKVTTLPVEYLPRAIVSGRLHGAVKLVADTASDRLLGAHIVAPNAGDTISEAVLAIRFGLRAQEVVSTLHPYLTWAEGVKLAGQTFTKDVAKLSCCA